MSDVRNMPAVGVINKPTEEQLKPGYEAQGFALAMSIRGMVVNHARDLQRAVMQAFTLSHAARAATVKNLNAWKKEAKENALANVNLAGLGDRALSKLASSATTRTYEFTAIIKAMDAGMTKDTLAQKAGVDDVENISFHAIVAISRQFIPTEAKGGRPADPFAVKLAKWLAKNKDEGDEVYEQVKERVQDLLPTPETK